MSAPLNIPTPYKRAGRPRCPITHLLALEYLLWPIPRPYGLQKALAHANNIKPEALNATVNTIKHRATTRARKAA
jgi:hypothetical protein